MSSRTEMRTFLSQSHSTFFYVRVVRKLRSKNKKSKLFLSMCFNMKKVIEKDELRVLVIPRGKILLQSIS